VLHGVDRLRAGALLLAGAAVVHEGRVLAEGHGGLARNPHDAVPLFVATAVVLLALAGARFAAALRSDRARRRRSPVPSLAHLWAGAAASLVAVHFIQEFLEGGPSQALAPATLVAVACALLVAAALALVLREAERLIESRAAAAPSPVRSESSPLRPARRLAAPRDVLARHLAGRAPPPRA
jgi:hypothetical protein